MTVTISVNGNLDKFESIHGNCGDARTNHITKKLNPSTRPPEFPHPDDFKRKSSIPLPYSEEANPANWESNDPGEVLFKYGKAESDLGEGWTYLYENGKMADFFKHIEENASLEELRRYSPHEHALSSAWAKQMPFHYSCNNYIYVHDYLYRFTDDALKRMREGAFTLPNMPLNRDKKGVNNSKSLEDKNSRAKRRTPGIVSPLLDPKYMYDYLDEEHPYFVGEQGGKGVIFRPDFSTQKVKYNHISVIAPAGISKKNEITIKDRIGRELMRGESYYLSLSPADEDFRPCDGTVWYNTSNIGVSLMSRDGTSKIVLPNVVDGLVETLMDNDFLASESFPHSGDIIGSKKGLWCVRTIQGGLESLYENLKMLGILDKIDQTIKDKENSDAYNAGLRITVDDIKHSFGDTEELLKALTEMGIPISVIDDSRVAISTRDKEPVFEEKHGVYAKPYSHAVVYGLTVAYFISEENLRKARNANKALYDTELDVLINTLYKRDDKETNGRRYGTPVPVIHPHVYDNLARIAFIQRRGGVDVNYLNVSSLARDWHMPSLYSVGSCALVSSIVKKLYQRVVVGNKMSVVEVNTLIDRKGRGLRDGVEHLEEGVYVLQNSTEAGELIQIRIDVNDIEKLSEYGIYHYKDEAEAYLVDKKTEARLAAIREKEAELAEWEARLKEARLKQGDKALDHADRKLDREEQSDVAKTVIDMMERERKSKETIAKAKAERMSAMSNMLIGTGTILAAAASLGTLAMKYMSAKTTTATAAKAALSAAGSGTISTGVGTALGVVAKVGAAVGTGIAAASSTPLVLVGLGLAAIGGVCAWAAGWFD